MRWLVAAGVSATAWITALVVMASTEVGPVLAQPTQHHGLHLGDVAALGVAAVVSVAAFVVAYAGRRGRRRSPAAEPPVRR